MLFNSVRLVLWLLSWGAYFINDLDTGITYTLLEFTEDDSLEGGGALQRDLSRLKSWTISQELYGIREQGSLLGMEKSLFYIQIGAWKTRDQPHEKSSGVLGCGKLKMNALSVLAARRAYPVLNTSGTALPAGPGRGLSHSTLRCRIPTSSPVRGCRHLRIRRTADC